MRRNIGIVLLAVLAAWWGMLATAHGQSALDRLEQQIRERVDTAGSGETAPTRAPPAPPIEPQRAAESSAAGYLGAVVDDQKDRGRGVRVTDVQRGSPAEKGGLRRQDLITALAGIRVRQLSDMSEILGTFGPGKSVDFDIVRDGKAQKVRVVLGQRAAAVRRVELPESVPLPGGESLPEPPEPQLGGPQLEPAKTSDRTPTEASRIERLERRLDELERRMDHLEQMLKASKKE